MKRIQLLALCLVGIAILLWVAGLLGPLELAAGGRNDFLGIFLGAKLAGTGGLYDLAANQRAQAELVGGTSASLLYIRLPFQAVLLRPLAELPYQHAYALCQFVSVTAFALFLWMFARSWPPLLFFASLSVPLVACLMNGQDVTILAAAYGAFFLLSERGRPYAAGLALALCLIKPHFFLPTLIALVVRREWRIIAGASTGAAALLGLSFASEGWWLPAFLARLSDPMVHLNPALMPNLRGLELPGWAEASAVVAVLVMVAFLGRRLDRTAVYSAALVAGVLTSWHAYSQDALLMLVALAISARSRPDPALMIAVNPALYLLLLTGAGWQFLLPVACAVCLLRHSVEAGGFDLIKRLVWSKPARQVGLKLVEPAGPYF